MSIRKYFLIYIVVVLLPIKSFGENVFIDTLLHEIYYGYKENKLGTDSYNSISFAYIEELNSDSNWITSVGYDINGESPIGFNFSAGYLHNLLNPIDFINIFGSIDYFLISYDDPEGKNDNVSGLGVGLGSVISLTSKIDLLVDYKVGYVPNDDFGGDTLKTFGIYLKFSK